VAQDFESGIAVLSIPVRDRPAASLGDSRGLAVGQDVFILAIPVHLFTEHREDLLRFGRVPGRTRRAWVGFFAQPTELGIVVAGVVPEAPASRSGIREGDVIVAVNLREVETRQELYQEMWKHEAGAPLSFSILREGRRTTVEVVTTDRAEFYR